MENSHDGGGFCPVPGMGGGSGGGGVAEAGAPEYEGADEVQLTGIREPPEQKIKRLRKSLTQAKKAVKAEQDRELVAGIEY